MKKRVLSCLMALALCLTLLPAAAASAYYDDYYDGYYGSGHTHYLCGAGSSSDDYAPGSGSCTCSPKETYKTNFTTELRQRDGTLTKGSDAWSATDSNYVLEGGTYYLSSNLTLEHGILITGNVTLCLNGYSITCDAGADTSNPVPVITVSETGCFTLTNCRSQTYWDYKITHTEGKYGCGVYNEGTFNMYGGNITGNMAINYAGVYNKGTFNMYGGKISDNKSVGNESSTFNDGEGGGVYNGDPLTVDTTAAFTMYGGTISGNTAVKGGGVYNKGTFELSGGTISGNTAAQGGGVYSWGSGTTFTMSGGVIGGTKENSVNTAEYYGGGVSNQDGSEFTMSGGLIAGNTVTNSDIGAGGGVFNNAKFTMSGGKIGDSEAGKNTSANLGGGVYTSGTFTMSGSAEVSYNTAASKGGGVYNNCNTFSLTDGSITNNTAATGGGVYCDRSDTEPGNVILSGNARIANNHAGDANSNLYLLENGTVAANGLSADAGIGVSTAVDVAGSQRNVQVTSDTVSANYFTSDNTTYITQIAESNGTGYVVLTQRSASTTHDHSCVCGATHIHSNGHDTEKNLTNWVGISDLNLITGAGNYYLTDNITLTKAIAYDSGSYCGWKAPDGVVLCLNGKNITMQNPDDLVSESGKAKNADVILVTGRFTLTDCTGAQGKITHATSKIGRGITVLGGTLDMYGGQITGNTTTEYGTGGGVRVEGAEDAASSTTFNLYGGSINGNQSGYGGGVYVSRVVWEGASQFNMYGGSITGNTSTVPDETSSYGIGGGVCVSWTAAFKMTGGSITGNTAKFDGAGVYLSALAKSYPSETGEQRTAKFEVSGSPNITGNKVNNAENNVYLDTDTQTNTYFTNTVDASITILEGLGDDTKIGVTAKKVPTLGNRVLAATGATTNKNYSSIFTSDNASYEVQNRNDGTLRLAVRGDSSADSSHVHSWTYAIKEGTTNTIVATCNAAGCPNPNGGSVTITAPEHKTYDDGKSAEAQLTKANWQGKNIDENSITYGKQDGTPLTVAPTEAGEYKASITVDGAAAFVVYEITGGTTENIPVSGVALNKTSTSISVGNSEKLTATVTPENAANKDLKWASSNTSVATVAPDGTVTAVKAGTAAITATAADGSGKSATCTVTVTGGTTPSQPGGSTGGSSSGGSDSNPVIKTETKNNPDGSTTKTETKKDGTVIETTTGKDGSVSKTETKKNGSSVTENKAADGSTGTIKTDKNGQTEAKTALSNKAVEDAKKSGEPVKAPVEVEASRNSNTAPTVKVELPKGAGETKVEIPVSNVKPGTVAVLVHPDGTEEILKDSIPTEDGIQLTVDSGATVKIVDNSKDFIDTRNHWAEDEIDFVSARGLVNGMSATIYAPNASTTRAQLWTILARQNDADLNGGSVWYEKAQNWAKEKGVSDGENPNAAINRAQMVTMLWRAVGQPTAGGTANFIDVPTDSYYASAVAWAVENGITTGIGNGLFGADKICTRAQIAAFLARSMR